MDAREKLVELLEPHMSGLACEYESGSCELTSCRSCNARNIADHLIAHGVTVQEWIPVKDRLPEPKHEFDARNWYLVALSNGVVKELAYEFHNHSVFGYGWREKAYPVTHWMPLPQPPKVE